VLAGLHGTGAAQAPWESHSESPSERPTQSLGDTHPVHRSLARSHLGSDALVQSVLLVQVCGWFTHKPVA
jgi:hypothetical protein